MLSSFRASAQSPAETRNKADELFEKEDYAAAMPLYSGLLANDKDDPNLNYRYGVCVLYAGSQKDQALPFLEKASKSPGVDVEVWYFLGRAYHLNYQFDQAITAYNKFKTLGGSKKAEKMQVDNQLAMCKTGRKLLKAITDITVLDKAELSEQDFFRRYDLKGAGYSGQLLVKPDEFKTALDRKKHETSVIFLSGEKNELFFSSYGDDEENGKDIYGVRKLPNGNWGKPYNLGYPINTEYDEDYPFLHPNGKVLYFSSKGHKSMGGYDIFRSELNEETNTWQAPVNLDFAINSPDDDILFISDFEEKTAWFASNRNSPAGKMTVYHVLIERKPVNMCLIAGTFRSTDGDPNFSAKITVKNSETNEPVGVYKSNEKTGAYLMNLPNNGGKYTFTVEHNGIHTQTQNVFIPPQYEIKTVNQRIGYRDFNGEPLLYVETDFTSDSSMLDPQFLKDKAKLDISGAEATQVTVLDEPGGNNPAVGPENNPEDSTDETDTTTETGPAIHVPSSQSGVSNAELVKSAYEDAADTRQEANNVRQQSQRAYTYASDLNSQAKSKTQEAAKAKADADAMPEGPAKTAAAAKAEQLQAEANALQAQTVAAFQVAQALENDAKQKEQEAAKAEEYASTLDKAVKSNDPKALDKAGQQAEELQAMSETRPQGAETAKNLGEEAGKKHKALDKAKTEAQDLREENALNQQRIDQLNAEAAKEKDPEQKQGILDQIEGIKEDMADNEAELKKLDANVARLENETNEADQLARAANDALTQSKNTAVAPTAINEGDKKALGSDVLAYQQSVSESGAGKTYAPVTEPVSQGETQQGGTQQGGTTEPVSQGGTQQGGTQQGGTTEPVAQGGTQQGGTQQGGTTEPVAQGGTQQGGTQQGGTTEPAAQGGTQQGGTQQGGTQQGGTQQGGTTEPVAQGGTQQDGTQQGGTTEPVAQGGTTQSAESENPDLPFENSLKENDSISDPVAREKARAQTYTDWAASLDQRIREEKQALAAAKTKPEKDSINALIKQLQASTKEKKDQAAQSQVAARNAEQQQQSQASSPAAVVGREFAPKLTEAESQPGADRENARAQVYADWADSLDAVADRKEKDLKNVRGREKQEQAKQEIAALRSDAEEKRKLSQEAKDKAAEIVAQQNTSAVEAGAAPSEVKYSEPSATAALGQKAAFEEQARRQHAQQDSLLQIASAQQGAERTQTLTQATAAQREAWKAEEQASMKQGEANTAQFNANQEKLNGYNAAAASSSDPSVASAQLLSEEAADLFRKAQEERKTAAEANDNYTRSESLRQADEDEQKAIQKQQQALARYQQSGLQPIAGGTQQGGTTQPVTQGGTQQGGTTQPVTQGGTQQGGTTQPVTQGETQQGGTTQPVTQGGTQQGGTTQPTTQGGTQQGGTTQPVTQGGSTQPVSQGGAVIDPESGQPMSASQLETIRGTNAYRNYVAADRKTADAEVRQHELQLQADAFQRSADQDVAKAQDFALQAADENDPTKKQQLINESKRYNDAARAAIASRDSVNRLADVAAAETASRRKEADRTLDGIDKTTAGQVKAVATADVPRTQGGSTSRTGTEPVTQGGTQQGGTTQPVTQGGTQQGGSQQGGTTQPVTQGGATQGGSQQGGTTQPVTQGGSTQGGSQQGGSTQPVTQGGATQGGSQQGGSTQPVTQGGSTQGGTQPVVRNTNPGSSVTQRLAPGEQFRIVQQAASAPVVESNPTLSDSIVFKVQVGAFRNPISAEIFKGIQPLATEQTAAGLTRYTAGYFTVFSNADAAKNEIRGMGFRDAFVVAFYKGKRISVDEALRRSGQPQPVAQGTQGGSEPVTQGGSNPSTQGGSNPATQGGGTQQPDAGTTTQPGNVASTDVVQEAGLFYTVQVGVYRVESNATRLRTLPNLYRDVIPGSGLVRFSSGKYNNANAAVSAKNEIVGRGISDAFVTAYYNGKRITLAEAQALEAQGVKPGGSSQPEVQGGSNPSTQGGSNPSTQGGSNPSTQGGSNPSTKGGSNPSTQGGSNPSTQGGSNPSTQGGSNPSTQGGSNPSTQGGSQPETQGGAEPGMISTHPPVPDTGIVFSVQLGAFRDEVPVDIATKFLQFSSRGVKNYLDTGSGLTVYQVGVYTSREAAQALRDEAVAKGIPDAFIVAFKNGKKISMEEAMQEQ